MYTRLRKIVQKTQTHRHKQNTASQFIAYHCNDWWQHKVTYSANRFCFMFFCSYCEWVIVVRKGDWQIDKNNEKLRCECVMPSSVELVQANLSHSTQQQQQSSSPTDNEIKVDARERRARCAKCEYISASASQINFSLSYDSVCDVRGIYSSNTICM